ncbi:GMC family oxidoreductase [Parahaliea aestuarii]|uniref:GMC family oxidoreductase n=2 Tax=Parahaliea aestuarii TaxID=1852021 RepID=A0A5C8ZYC0_9GAMM|nr:GMC family oxidoreductase [Parahaliea aestuarii]TXS93603.1 GMC family oxidoreductase [Parahaliea aestuarii]
MIQSENYDFDAIVVGSGISGGWAAKELTEKGLKVLVLERGRDITPGLDYYGEHAPDWKLPYQGKKPRELYENEYPIQSHGYALNEGNRQFWNNDKDNPYVFDAEKPFYWMRADVVGGRSLIWGRQTYRWCEQDFTANATDGHGIPWPIGYCDLAPWYSHVEQFAGISGEALGLDELPDSEFLKPMEMHALEKTIQGRLRKKAPHVHMTIGRVAILSEDHNGRAACHYCGPCDRGCSTGSYFSSHSATLPAARATGNLTLKANAVVERLEYDAQGGRVSAVHVIDSQTGERSAFRARLYFLCASTVGSTQILMNSRSEAFPDGLGNRSGALGHYMMDHVYGVGITGIFYDDMDRYWFGNRPNGTYIPRFRNLGDQDDDAGFLRGYGYQGAAMRMDWKTGFNKRGFGADLKESLRKPGPWVFHLAGFGEVLPQYANRMYLDAKKVDRFGIPQVGFSCQWGDNERMIRDDMLEQGEALMKAAGAVFTVKQGEMGEPGLGIHEMGTARMGDDPTQSVVNAHNQVHGAPNVFVTDGACMTSSSCVNPSLTYMALTARACDYAVKQLAQGRL